MANQKSISLTAWVLLILLAFIFGGSFLSFAVALRELPVFTIVALRVGIAAIALWIFALWRGVVLPKNPRIYAAFLVMGLLQNVIPFSLIAWGQIQIESGLASILNATTALFGIIVAAIFLPDERMTGRKLGGVLLGFSGVAVVMGLETLRHFDLRSLAQLAILGSSLSYGLAGSWGRRMLSGIDPVTSATLMLTAASVAVLPMALLIDGVPKAIPGWDVIAAIGYISIFATALAFVLAYRVMALAGAGNVMQVTLMVVPVAVVLGAVVLGETLPHTAYAGFALIALGLVVIDGRLAKVMFLRGGIQGGNLTED